MRMLTRYVDQTTGEPHKIRAAAWSLRETCHIDAVWHGAPNCESDEEEWYGRGGYEDQAYAP